LASCGLLTPRWSVSWINALKTTAK
jgi:hypothetical protein